jgi:cyclopropane-fatty-acyl-phospholipid synthase
MSTNPAIARDGEVTARQSVGPLVIARGLLAHLFDGSVESLAVELADGTSLYAPRSPARATIVARDLGALRSLILGPSSAAAATAVVRGDLDVRGDIEFAIGEVENASERLSTRDRVAVGLAALRLPSTPSTRAGRAARDAYRPRGRKHSRSRDKASVSYHYNVSNEFYSMWLDRELVYSCAYFRDSAESLDQAQLDKLDHICRKLRLRSGERFLDVGCGWGSLVRFAAREYGCKAVGITLSSRQAEYAREKIAAEGLSGRCSVDLVDYRELAPLGPFDKAASVGMVEHVGTAMLPVYFRAVYDALAPGGLFLNHGITSQRQLGSGVARFAERLFPKRSTFIDRYVFPDGDLPTLGEIIGAAESSGFEVRDVENLREHYAMTLRHWVRRLEANEAAARAAVGDETYNVWRFYIAGSAHGFSIGRMGLDQTLLVKRHPDGEAGVPQTRADIYRA